MFARKLEADAQVVAAENLQGTVTHDGPSWHETWRWILDVRPAAGAPYRVMVEDTIKRPHYVAPKQGDPVTVEYEAKAPEKVGLKLKGDRRYDSFFAENEWKKEQKEANANRVDPFGAALDAPPGTPFEGDDESER